MRLAIYARVSTADQSCDPQLRDLRMYCTARGFALVREYVDTGHSGTKDSRPALNELMADARKRQIDAILVWRFDRFARSTKHLLLALEEFRSLGIQFISYQENLDTTSPLGQALFTIVAAVAQLERDLIRERVSAGIRNARANGKHLGRPRREVMREEVVRLQGAGRRRVRVGADKAGGRRCGQLSAAIRHAANVISKKKCKQTVCARSSIADLLSRALRFNQSRVCKSIDRPEERKEHAEDILDKGNCVSIVGDSGNRIPFEILFVAQI